MTTAITAPSPAVPAPPVPTPTPSPIPTPVPTAGDPARRPVLSAREQEVLLVWLLCDTKQQVTEQLFLAPSTVNTYIQRVRTKYDEVDRPARTKAMLLVRAVQDRLLDLEGM